jgi:membrane associated rhomboid family serine protease
MHQRFSGYSRISPYGMTPMVKRIMIACGVVWVLQLIAANMGRPFTELAWIRYPDVFGRFWFWQPFTYLWLHDPDSPMHLLFNMFTLWMFGGTLEATWGSQRFLRFYLICGFGAGMIILGWHVLTANPFPTLGASGAIYGVLTAFSLMWPDRRVMLLFPPVPMKAIYFIPVLLLLQLAFERGGRISHIGHLGGVLVAAFLMRDELRRILNLSNLRLRMHRWRMRRRLHSVQRDEWERKRRQD